MARSTNLTVNITGDSRDLLRAFKQAEQASSQFGRNVQRDLDILATWAKRGALAIGAIATTVLGISLKGGIDRLMGLERANKQLQQLGVEGQDADRLMDALLTTLRGTPFALDAGAKSLAGFVASGRDLADIPRLVQQVTDAAAFGNTTLEDMDFIWQRVQTTGRITNRELQMLAERNIPVYQQLAGAMGITAQEVRDLAASGQLSADMFFDAWEAAADGTIENTVRIEGAAKAMGDTTEGAFANMRTAMSRFGALLLEDLFPLAKDVFNAIGEGFDRMGEVFKRTFTDIDTSKFEGFIENIPDMMERAAESIISVWEATGFLRDRIGDLAAGIIFLTQSGILPAVAAAWALKAVFDALKAHPIIGGLALIATGIGIVVNHVKDLEDAFDDLVHAALEAETSMERLSALKDIFTENEMAILEQTGALEGLLDGTMSYAEALQIVQSHTEEVAESYAGYGRETYELRSKLHDLADAEREVTDALIAEFDEHRNLNFQRGRSKRSAEELTAATDDNTGSIRDNIDAIREQEDALRSQIDPIFAVISAHGRYQEAQEAVTAARDEFGEGSPEHIAALADQGSAVGDLRRTYLDLKEAGADTREEFIDLLVQWGYTRQEAGILVSELEKLDGVKIGDKSFTVTENYIRNQTTNVHTRFTSTGSAAPGVSHEGEHRVPGVRGSEHLRVVQAGERILSAADADRMDKGQGAGTVINITVEAGVSDPYQVGKKIIEMIQHYNKIAGGALIEVRSTL